MAVSHFILLVKNLGGALNWGDLPAAFGEATILQHQISDHDVKGFRCVWAKITRHESILELDVRLSKGAQSQPYRPNLIAQTGSPEDSPNGVVVADRG